MIIVNLLKNKNGYFVFDFAKKEILEKQGKLTSILSESENDLIKEVEFRFAQNEMAFINHELERIKDLLRKKKSTFKIPEGDDEKFDYYLMSTSLTLFVLMVEKTVKHYPNPTEIARLLGIKFFENNINNENIIKFNNLSRKMYDKLINLETEESHSEPEFNPEQEDKQVEEIKPEELI